MASRYSTDSASGLPLVSIGVPVFNEESRLADCISQLSLQTYPSIEICISDNASTDRTYEIAKALAAARNDIRIVRQASSIGAFPNFDAVRRMARGKYFMWLGADDRLHPTYVEKTVDQLESHTEAVAAQSAIRRVDDDGNVINEVRLTGRYNPNNVGPLLQAMTALSPFKAVRAYKFNLYVYALYRKAILDRIMDEPENILNKGDRVLPAIAALSGGLRYVDEFLFSKHVHTQSYQSRQPDDPLVVERRRHNKLRHLIGWVWTSPTVPPQRRWYGLIIALPYLLAKTDNGLRRLGLPPLAGTKLKF